MALFEANRVVSCSAAAQAEGVRRGSDGGRLRCGAPAGRGARRRRPGSPRVRAVAGPARGGEPGDPGDPARARGAPDAGTRPVLRRRAARRRPAALEAMTGAGVVKAGVADGMFAAEQAAYDPEQIRVVPRERRLLVRSASGEPAGRGRAGRPAAPARRPHSWRLRGPRRGPRPRSLRRARPSAARPGRRPRPARRCRAPLPSTWSARWSSPRPELVEQVAFATRETADAFVAGLAAHHLVCTELRVILTAEEGERAERVAAPGRLRRGRRRRPGAW